MDLNRFSHRIWERLPDANIAFKKNDGFTFEISYKGKTVTSKQLTAETNPDTAADQVVTKLFFMLHPNKASSATIPKTF